MKKNLVFVLFSLVLGTVYSFAQRKQVTEEYTKGTVLTIPYSMMPGKVTYGYVVSDDGKHVKDGAYNVKCSLVNRKYTSSPYNITLNGNYTLSANFLKGNLNGAISASYNLNFTAATRLSTQKETFTSTFEGNFKDGIPHGNFIVNSKLETKQQLNVNYNNGILVGPYSCSVVDDGLLVECKGALDTKGKLTGTWTYKNKYYPKGRTMQFQNNVLINDSYSDSSTKPAIVALAKKYAAGSISKEELMKQDVLVAEDSITLGDYARLAILGDEVVDLENLGGYDFTLSNTIKYEYLCEAVFMTEAGVTTIINHLTNSFLSEKDCHSEIFTLSSDKNLPCIYTHVAKDFIGKDLPEGRQKIYMSKKQLERIDSCIYETKKQHVLTLENFLEMKKENTLLNFFKGENILSINYDRIQNQALDLVFSNYTPIKPYNSEYYTLGYDKIYSHFLEKEAAEKLILLAGRYDMLAENASDSEKQRLKAIENDLLKKIEEGKYEKMQANFKPTFDFMMNKSAVSIAYDDDAKYYFDTPGLELSQALKPYCKIIDYEIIKIDAKNIVVKLTKYNKKGNTEHEVTWEWRYESWGNRYLIKVSSIENTTGEKRKKILDLLL